MAVCQQYDKYLKQVNKRFPVEVNESVPIPIRKLLKLQLINLRHLIRINRHKLILLVPMPHEPRPPLALRDIRHAVSTLLEEVAESTVSVDVHLTAFKSEALRDMGFHLRYSPRAFWVDVRGCAEASVHDEGALVHAGLRGCDEVFVGGPAGP